MCNFVQPPRATLRGLCTDRWIYNLGLKITEYLTFCSVGLMSFTHFDGIRSHTCLSSEDSTRQRSVTTSLLKPGRLDLKMTLWLEGARVWSVMQWEQSWWSGPLSLQFANNPPQILRASWSSLSAHLNNSPVITMVSNRHQLDKFNRDLWADLWIQTFFTVSQYQNIPSIFEEKKPFLSSLIC